MPTKPDSEIIQAAYEAIVSKIFVTFVDNLASGDSKEDAEAKFSKGIQLAKTTRDRAMQLI
jgi:hypothetical protein